MIAPLAYFFLNLGLSIFFSIDVIMYLSFIPIILILIKFLIEVSSERKRRTRYKTLYEQLLPIIVKFFNEHNVYVGKEDTHLVYYRQFQKNHLDIRIMLPFVNNDIIEGSQTLETTLKNVVDDDVLIKLYIEKKAEIIEALPSNKVMGLMLIK
ncbi:MAG: hypothetical protein K0Q53_1961 [Massilibacillus sp.]|jgi:hypothetical protein|nr:hypothetical protein [Massilibacillus sp.]